jgi:hypothetical protein
VVVRAGVGVGGSVDAGGSVDVAVSVSLGRKADFIRFKLTVTSLPPIWIVSVFWFRCII